MARSQTHRALGHGAAAQAMGGPDLRKMTGQGFCYLFAANRVVR